jgi:hypothetical protein
MFPQPDSSYIFDNIERYMKLFKQDKPTPNYFTGYILYDDNWRIWGFDDGLGVYLFVNKEHAIAKQHSLYKAGENWTVGEFRLYKHSEYHVANR